MTDLMSLVSDWVPQQRWYVGEHAGSPGDDSTGAGRRAPSFELLGSYSLGDPERDPDVRFITVAMLRDTSTRAGSATGGGEGVGAGSVYQVPLVIRNVDSSFDARGYLGTYDTGSGRAAVIDGVHDTAFARALLALIEGEQTARGPGGSADGLAVGLPMPGSRAGRVRASRALQGEQSNSSIVLQMRERESDAEAAPLIVKVFRTLHNGENPDVTLQSALAAAGSLRVPPALGHVAGEWPDPSQPGGRARGHLAFAQEFFAGVEDAWRVARRAAESGDDFTAPAYSLGEATAETHEVLRTHLPEAAATPAEVERAIGEMRARLRRALELVPALREQRVAVERAYERAADAPWPNLQRIHGDYHLGQVLAVPERGWVLLDFEGEPLRPLAERNALDLPARDVAGMLRSFDYVAGALSLAAGHDVVGDWAQRAREAFLLGYASRGGGDAGAGIDARILAAYELDKAVYEAIYEASHRPDWLPIPVAAVGRLLGE
ncbi:trehalose biosynthesis protein [Pseudoclavibacter endophyticus]|uniref:Maltokinase n=1 Tax=Pseudoclavibacter endophyticus TaxID=1778590 RepID=A0A6H9WPV8_9MICO|nr:phosphotransferase [Pseudoclavibacter endophyticus]KAB1649017.1 phosphotransferase [Pseudoclavibacter endophyticus]GGA66183.1 trehalose biosynthesis protein [Pseudoclavibacter endophyticus]